MIREKISLETWIRLLEMDFSEKIAITLGVNLLLGPFIFVLAYYFNNIIFFTLFALPVSFTSFFYASRFNVIPALIGSVIYIVALTIFLGNFHVTEILLTTPILYILSIAIGYAGYELLQWVKAENRKDLLNTILRQDLRSNNQLVLGYLQLIQEDDLSEENRNYFKKAREAALKENEVLELAQTLRKIDGDESLREKDLTKIIDEVLDEILSSDKSSGIEIEKKYDDSISKIKGTYSLKYLFVEILKSRLRSSKCSEIEIDTYDKGNKVLVQIEDDGKEIHPKIKDLLSKEEYSGNTTGDGGFRYYMIRQIAEQNEADIDVNNIDLDRVRFAVELKKAM